MTNTNLLKGKIKSFGLTIEDCAIKLGISTTSLSYKINNKVDFKASEIERLSGLLQIDKKDEYFFYS